MTLPSPRHHTNRCRRNTATLPLPTAPPIVWACFMGCTTAARLANEWGITERGAYFRLNYARRKGWLRGRLTTSRKGLHRIWSVTPKMMEIS